MSGSSGRLLSLLSLLQARRDWPGHVLAERLGVSSRTVRRDVGRLRELGYPVQASLGPDGGYRLAPGADLPPLLFDDDQAVALAVALQLAVSSGAQISDGAVRALATVRQVMPSRLRHRVDALHVTVIPDTATAVTDPGVLVAVTDAVRATEVLRFDYAGERPGEGEPPVRRVQPHGVLARRGCWYLLAWDLDRDDWRTFRLDRMTPRTPTGPRFVPRDIPGGDAATFVSARFKGSDGPDTWPCQGTAVLDLPARAVLAHAPDATVEPVGPDRCRVTVGAWSWAGVVAAFTRFDTTLEVVGPPALTHAFAAASERWRRASTS